MFELIKFFIKIFKFQNVKNKFLILYQKLSMPISLYRYNLDNLAVNRLFVLEFESKRTKALS